MSALTESLIKRKVLLSTLEEVASNLSWSWNRDARALFRTIDGPMWHLTRHNPIALLQRTDPSRLDACAIDPEYAARVERVMASMEREKSSADTWFGAKYPDLLSKPIAYFCAEFAVHNSVPIYSGGLGVLAGDHCKTASDLGVPLVAVGLMYTRGYFDQQLRIDGWQEDVEERFDASITPLKRVYGTDGKPYLSNVLLGGHAVHVGAWKMALGRVSLYLLDTDLPENTPADRELSHRLYTGDAEMRFKQECILGIGGVRILRALEIDPAVWHANEGHAAFMLLERVRELSMKGVPFGEAVRQVRATSIFTTHTPVAAGHDMFPHEMLERVLGSVWEPMGIDRAALLNIGHRPKQNHDVFHMTAAAIRLSGRVNGVSDLHGEETRRIWQVLWPGTEVGAVPIRQITNGVHLATWMSHAMMDLLDREMPGWANRLDESDFWNHMLDLDDERLWLTHQRAKVDLLNYIREEARLRWRDHWDEASHLVGAGTLLDPFSLTIGFARRFATYKRADLLFHDVERLRRILVNPWCPVQIIFAGKAHPADEPGKRMLQAVYGFTRDPQFEGRIAFLEDYELHMAHRLVQGVDLWVNLPRIPMEACGTSGMKAGLNGVPHLSTQDGWWVEGYEGTNGWSIPRADGDGGDAADAENAYRILEDEIVPLFYERDERGVPIAWIQRMKHALRVAGSRFTTRRMVQRYVQDVYLEAMQGTDPGTPPPSA